MTQAESTDLKKFITLALHEQSRILNMRMDDLEAKIQQFGVDLRIEMHEMCDKLDAKIDLLAQTVFDTIEVNHTDHEVRIKKLEAKVLI